MEKVKTIIVEGVAISENTKIEEFISTGKFNLYENNHYKKLKTKEWITAFGELFSGEFYFGSDYIHIELYPKLEISYPGHPSAEYERASYDFCKSIIENQFDNVTYKEDEVSVTLPHGKISTFLGFDDGKTLCVGGYISIKVEVN